MSTLVPTMADVAREAGVSIVTVDRVLNKRAAVKPNTERKVLAAALRLNFALGKVQAIAGNESLQTVGQVPRRLAFFLLRQHAMFYQQLGQAISAAVHKNSAVSESETFYLDELSPQQCAELFLEKGQHCDAIALVSVDHPVINQAVDHLAKCGVRTYALVTDITATHRAGYVGLDNRKAGRTAAWAISRLARNPGKVGLLAGNHRFLCQELSEISFRSYLREHAPQFQVLDTRLTHEDVSQARRVAEALLCDHSDLTALYVNSGGIEGVMDALRASGRHADITVVGQEMMDSTCSGLVDGVLDLVISLPRECTARALVALMLQQPANVAQISAPAASVMLPFDLITPENI